MLLTINEKAIIIHSSKSSLVFLSVFQSVSNWLFVPRIIFLCCFSGKSFIHSPSHLQTSYTLLSLLSSLTSINVKASSNNNLTKMKLLVIINRYQWVKRQNKKEKHNVNIYSAFLHFLEYIKTAIIVRNKKGCSTFTLGQHI